METIQLREELHHFIDHADYKVLNLLYQIVKSDLQENKYELTDEHIRILNDRLAEYESNPESGLSWEEVKERIRKSL